MYLETTAIGVSEKAAIDALTQQISELQISISAMDVDLSRSNGKGDSTHYSISISALPTTYRGDCRRTSTCKREQMLKYQRRYKRMVEMTLLKLQHIMSNEIAKRAFLSRPPEPPAGVLMGDPFQSIFIGTTKIFKVPFTWSFVNLTNPHIAVVGITGAGKSYFVKTLLVRASYIWNTNAIIIDFAGEYRAWVKQSGGTVVSLGKGDYLNIMDLSQDEATRQDKADNEFIRDTY